MSGENLLVLNGTLLATGLQSLEREQIQDEGLFVDIFRENGKLQVGGHITRKDEISLGVRLRISWYLRIVDLHRGLQGIQSEVGEQLG